MNRAKYKAWCNFLWGVIVAAITIGLLRRGSDLAGTVKRMRQRYGI